MRPITGLFSDVVEILRLGWKQLLSIALLAGALAALVVAGAVAIGVDVSGLTELLRKTADAVAELTDPSVDDPDRSALQEAADIAFPLASGQYVVLLAATGILLLLVIATTVAGTVATSSAALRSGAVTFGPVLRTARRRALPTAAMLAVLGVVAVAPWLLSAVLVGTLVALTTGSGVAALLSAMLVLPAPAVFSVWMWVRLFPALPQTVLASKGLAWSWSATRGLFWAVAGRWLLWALVSGVLVQAIGTAIFSPAGVAAEQAVDAAGLASLATLSLVLWTLSVPLYVASSALWALGLVPIWRDLEEMSPVTDPPDR